MKSQRFLYYIKRQGKKVATFLKSRDAVTFLFFLVLSFLLWYIYSAGTQREISRRIPIAYIGIPDNVKIEKELPQKLKFIIKDKGKTIWSYQKSQFDTLKIDLTDSFNKNNTLEIKFEDQFNKILSQLSPTTQIIELNPNYSSSKYIFLYSKSVPVVTSNVIKLAPQHVMYDTIAISPKFVTLLGTKESVDTISYLYLEPITEIFDKTKTLTVNIQKPQGVNINRPSVNVTIPIEMCTEKEVKVPVIVENAPNNINIRTFPSEIKIKFSVGLSHYNSVTESNFRAILDYNDILNNLDKSTTTLQLDYTSGYIFNIQLIPSEVEYIIES